MSKVGDVRPPVRNHAPNPGNYWTAQVLFHTGWKMAQVVGETAAIRKTESMVKSAIQLRDANRERIQQLQDSFDAGEITWQEALERLEGYRP